MGRDKIACGEKTLTFRRRKKPVKVGDILRLFWKQRAKADAWGGECEFCASEPKCSFPEKDDVGKIYQCDKFTKKFGESVCTETFFVKIIKYSNGTFGVWLKSVFSSPVVMKGLYSIAIEGGETMLSSSEIEGLAKEDGFDSSEEFFGYFDKEFDLREGIVFQGIRWDKIKEVVK